MTPSDPARTRPSPGARRLRLERGAAAESRAAAHLQAAGLTILARNYRCKAGEIDLVAGDGATLVFVEVRLRGSDRFGGAAASIDSRKQAKIVLAAHHFLLGRSAAACRFDAVLVSPRGLEWIRDAFGT